MTQSNFLSTVAAFFGFFTHLWDSILHFHHRYYSRVEAKILEGEESERYRIKKSILFHHCYLVIILNLIIPLFNPEASILKSLGNIILAIGQMFILRSKNYNLIGSYVYFHAIISVFFQFITEGEPLTVIGQILANQHMFFLFPESKILRMIYIPVILMLVRNMQDQLIQGITSWNLDKIELILKTFTSTWPIVFFFHHYGAKNLTTSYRLALIENMQIQKELKETLSLLKTTNKNLNSALKSRELFIASVSHELRNPLNCLIGNIELLRLDVKNEKWLKTLDTCKICCEVLLGQINNVLDVAKINAEKLELHYLPINFHRLIEKVWSVSAIPIKQKKLKGEVRIARNFPKYINMDSHRLTQILLNLIGNASKFAKEGFVSITISWHSNGLLENLKRPSEEYTTLVNTRRQSSSFAERSRSSGQECVTSLHHLSCLDLDDTSEHFVEIEDMLQRSIEPKLISQVASSSFLYSTTDDVAIESKTNIREQPHPREKGMIKIEVVDTGCGVSEEALKQLFQPFKQADSSITRQFGGTGLGLYITKEIIQKMGGEIFAFSRENIGSNFCVVIPAETASKEEVKEEVNEGLQQDESLDEMADVRALIVDDTLDNQFILSCFLKKIGIQSDIANNGLEAVTMIRSRAPNYYNFITMDLQMPVMDGLSAMKMIRRYEKSVDAKETPIVVITANCADTEKNKCLDPKGEIRASNFFRKPFTFDECSSVVQSILADRFKSKKKVKVLIVDDDAFTTTVSQEYMQKHGFETAICSNGKDAVNLAKKEEFDIILMDCEMPEMNGYETASQVKKLRPGTLILGVTGHRREECLKDCLNNGMFDVETKPVDFKKIVSLISKIPHQKREFLK